MLLYEMTFCSFSLFDLRISDPTLVVVFFILILITRSTYPISFDNTFDLFIPLANARTGSKWYQ